MKTVSVVMATYNGARFIKDQLASLAAQTTLPFELIVSDDRSTDGTPDIIEEFSKDAPFPVFLRRNEHRLGYGENFLTATTLAKSDFIAFCDQDDVWHPNKLQVALDKLTMTDANLLVHPTSVIDQYGNHRGQFTQGITKSRIYRPLQLGPWSVFYGCSMVFPRRLLELMDFAERGAHTFEHTGLLSHDLWVYFLASSLGTVVVEEQSLIDYRQHGRNVTPTILTSGIRPRVRSLGVPADPRLPRHTIARHRSELMDKLSSSTNEPEIRRAAASAADYWRRIAQHESARIDLYTTQGAAYRTLKCATLARSGGYRAFRKGGLSWRLLLKDVLVGVARAGRSRTCCAPFSTT